MVKVLFNLYLQRLGEWSPILESLQRHQPAEEVFSPVYYADLRLVGAENLDEVTNNIGEKGHSEKHNDYREDLFNPTDRVIITIAHSGQCGQREVAARHNLSPEAEILESKL